MSWKLLSWIVTLPAVTRWLIRRAHRTPYTPIMSPDKNDVYMWRGWIFNPYPETEEQLTRLKRSLLDRLPSVRIHHIRRQDLDRDLHNHPWNARTIILRGWYMEERFHDPDARDALLTRTEMGDARKRDVFVRPQGYTGTLKCGEFHRITMVPEGGVWTLFITWRYQGTWGFDVDGLFVPHREYIAVGTKP